MKYLNLYENIDWDDEDFDEEEFDNEKEIFDRSDIVDFKGNKVYDLVVGDMYKFGNNIKVCYIGVGQNPDFPVLCLIIKDSHLIEWIPNIILTPMHISIGGYISSSKKIKRRFINVLLDGINGKNSKACDDFYKKFILDV